MPLIIVVKAVGMEGGGYYPNSLFDLYDPDDPKNRVFISHGCSDPHPLTSSHFVVLQPGESRVFDGKLRFSTSGMTLGKHRLRAAYRFKKIDLDHRYFPTPEEARLWSESVEVEQETPDFEIEVIEGK